MSQEGGMQKARILRLAKEAVLFGCIAVAPIVAIQTLILTFPAGAHHERHGPLLRRVI